MAQQMPKSRTVREIDIQKFKMLRVVDILEVLGPRLLEGRAVGNPSFAAE